MATIYFSLAGEGRGHATRVRAIVERLRHHHDVTVFAPDDAYALLAPLYRGTEVGVRRIAGLRFAYGPQNRIDFHKTGLKALAYLRHLPVLTSLLRDAIEHGRPDLVVADFEPAMPRVARRLGVPFLSLDHQHFLTTYDLSSLPVSLRWHACYMALIVRAFFSGQRETIVSSFYFPPLRRRCRRVTQVGVMLRDEVVSATPAAGSHLVAYWRRFAGPGVLPALQEIGRPVRVYGLGNRMSTGNLTFHEIDESRFLEDLAGCHALISTAGNQLIGEALYLGKPVLVLPETRNFEQSINAHFLRASGAGDWIAMDRLTSTSLRSFLERADQGIFASTTPRTRLNGVPATLAVLDRHLPGPRFPRLAGLTTPLPA